MTKRKTHFLTLLLSVVLAVLLTACGGSGGSTTAETGQQQPSGTPNTRDAQTIVLVSSDTWWDGIYLPTYVTKAILEDEMGYTVEVVKGGSVPDFLDLLSGGHADVFMSGWFPTNDFTFDQHPNLVRVGQVYGGRDRDAFEGWMATNDFARQYDIDSIQDLFNPAVIDALDSDNDGRGELIGCPQAWACSQRHAEILQDYGLDASYDMEPLADEEAMLTLVDNRTRASEPAVFYMYQPVAFPQEGTLEDRGTWITGTEPYLPLAFNRTVTRTELVASHPDVVHLMTQIRIPGADVGAAMRRVANEGRSADLLNTIGREWVAANESLVQSWLPAAPYTPTVETTYPPALPADTLTIAYSPDKEDLFLQLATAYNLTRDPETPPVHPVRVDVGDMVNGAVEGDYAAISPDSSLWVSQIDRAWQDANPDASPLVNSIERYALTPVVIAMLESRAESVGYPETPIGWRDLMTIAQEDPEFRWSHPSISSAAGLLSVTAEFYSATGVDNLTVADIQDEAAIEYVKEIEATVDRYGGESEDRVIVRNLAAGGQQLDAFVTQEQKVIFFNQNSPSTRLVAVYPDEGTFWMDHPLALLDNERVTDGQRRVFRAFARFVAQPEQQNIVLALGYRPADVSITLDADASLIREEFNVNPQEPISLLQVPSPGALEAIREAWLLTKRPANIVLVVDISGSMEGAKLSGVKGALFSFIDQIEGNRDQVALITFSDNATLVQALAPIEDSNMADDVRQLEAGGGTMLFDAVAFALDHLEAQEDSGNRAQVIVAMTDGQSDGSIETVQQRLNAMESSAIIYTVGYGEDADLDVLQRIAQLGEGQVYPSDTETISQLYALLSEYF